MRRLTWIPIGRIETCLLICLCIFPRMPALGGEQGKALLDEASAGSDANMELIRNAKAEYSVLTNAVYPKKETSSETVTVYFDGIRTRSDSGNERTIVTADRVMEYQGPRTDPGVIIRTRRFAPPPLAHPQMQGLRTPEAIGDVIRSVRENPKIEMQAEREGKLIKITYHVDESHAKNEFLAAPDQGYCVVRARQWNMLVPDRPYLEIESEFKRTDSGAFVLSRSKRIQRVMEKEGKKKGDPNKESDRYVVHDVRTTDISLVQINVKDEIDPNLFTLDGLQLPKRCRIQDRINGQEYLYGVPAISESDVGTAALSGPRRNWHPSLALVSAACLIGCVGWYLVRRRRVA